MRHEIIRRVTSGTCRECTNHRYRGPEEDVLPWMREHFETTGHGCFWVSGEIFTEWNLP